MLYAATRRPYLDIGKELLRSSNVRLVQPGSLVR